MRSECQERTPDTGGLRTNRSPEMVGWLYEVIEVAGSVHYAMYFNLLAADDVEDEVRFNDQDPIAIFSKFRMPRYSP
jgi:hypothetical protein